MNINDQAQRSAATVADPLSARIEALEFAFKWLFDRVANESYTPEQMRYSFSADIDTLADDLIRNAIRQPPARLGRVVQTAAALKALADSIHRRN